MEQILGAFRFIVAMWTARFHLCELPNKKNPDQPSWCLCWRRSASDEWRLLILLATDASHGLHINVAFQATRHCDGGWSCVAINPADADALQARMGRPRLMRVSDHGVVPTAAEVIAAVAVISEVVDWALANSGGHTRP